MNFISVKISRKIEEIILTVAQAQLKTCLLKNKRLETN